MAEPFIGEIKMVSFNYPPKGWALCNGDILPIKGNEALFSLLGTQFGGDGRTNFALPDLRGRTPVHPSVYAHGDVRQGDRGGLEEVPLDISNWPVHSHTVVASNEAADMKTAKTNNEYFAVPESIPIYGNAGALVSFSPLAVSTAGDSKTVVHENMQPSTVTNFVIALVGAYPQFD